MKDQYLIVDGSFLHKYKCHRYCIQCSNKKYNICIDSVVFNNTNKINMIHFKNKKVHNDNGPAIEEYGQYKMWVKNGLLHREDGSAFESGIYGVSWWYNGKHVNCKDTQEFLGILKYPAFI